MLHPRHGTVSSTVSSVIHYRLCYSMAYGHTHQWDNRSGLFWTPWLPSRPNPDDLSPLNRALTSFLASVAFFLTAHFTQEDVYVLSPASHTPFQNSLSPKIGRFCPVGLVLTFFQSFYRPYGSYHTLYAKRTFSSPFTRLHIPSSTSIHSLNNWN